MRISLRSMLIAGVSTLAVSSLVASPVRVTPDHQVAQVSAPVQLSAAVTPLPKPDMTSALAEIGRITGDLGLSAADVTAANPASDFVNWVYAGIIQWTDYFALELAPYVLQFLPWGWVITDQIFAIYPPIVQFTDSVVLDLIDPVLNDPLNLEVWANGLSAVAYTAVASLINVAINEVNVVIDYFLSWLPPLPPIPPWPPFPVAATTTLAADTATAALPGLIANPIAGASNLAANIAHTLVNLWYPPSDLIDGGVGFTTNLLGGLSGLPLVGVANFQLKEFWSLIETSGDTMVEFANDLISITNDLVANTVYDGIVPAFDDALWTTVQSLQTRGDAAVGAVTNFSLDQLQYFTGVYLPHTVNPDVDLPQGPPNATRFATPQVLRDILGPLAGLIPTNTVTLPTEADVTAAAPDSTDSTDSTDEDVAALDQKTETATTDESPASEAPSDTEETADTDETQAPEESTASDDADSNANDSDDADSKPDDSNADDSDATGDDEADDSKDVDSTEDKDADSESSEKADSGAQESAESKKSETSEASADD